MSETKKVRRKRAVAVIIGLLVILAVLALLQRLVMPKYMGDVKEGALISEYYDEDKDFDVVFIGDCEVYENFVPATLWENYGINSYIRGSAQQLIWQSYYLMEETLQYEKPDVIVFNVLSLQYNEPQKEAYNRMTIDGMRWSTSKVGCIQASMLESENFIEYVFPLLRYHDRWSELEPEDFQYLLGAEKVGHNGYYMQVGVVPVDYIPEGKILGDYSFGENAWSYLDKMVALCEENDVELILIKAPSLYPEWYEEWDVQVEEYAAEHNLKYINFLEHTEEIGLDYSTDTYDAGLHLNLYGAVKLTDYFGAWLAEECELRDRRDEEALAEVWEVKLEDFYTQKEELEALKEEE